MKIKKILWCDFDTLETDMIVSDGEIEMRVYKSPYEEIDLSKATFIAVGASDIVVVDKDTPDFVQYQLGGGFESTIIAHVKSIREQTVTVGKVVIELDGYFPGDACIGDAVKFNALRITMI